jgi:hypothetical protein
MDEERKWADFAEAAAPDIFPKHKYTPRLPLRSFTVFVLL